MKSLNIFAFLSILVLVACNKYSNIDSQQISGHAYLHDTLSSQNPLPVVGQLLYLNIGTDTTSSIFRAKTDSAGHFSLTYPGKSSVMIYSRFVLNGTEYTGQVTVSKPSGYVQKNLSVYPLYTNGLSINFDDVSGGLIPNLPFRLYTSKVMATLDSTRFANITSQSNINGQYSKYNLLATKYYIVVSDSIGGHLLNTLDSVMLAAKGIFRKTVILK